MKRRDFLKSGLFAGLGGFTLSGRAGAQTVKPPIQPTARNIIFYVYDGFGWEDFAVAQQYARRVQGRALALERLFSLGVTGSQTTYSLTSIVTDSAAASTVWASGRKVDNQNIGTLPDGRPLKTILELAKDRGKATGLITTTHITHATPAGFASHVIDRDMENEIAAQYVETGLVDVMLGGGSRHFDPSVRPDKRDLWGEASAKGYGVLKTVEDLERSNGSRLLGTFSRSHIPYEVDRRFQGVVAPSLSQMARKGLSVLSGYSNGFVAQIEAGRIDHGNHENDVGAMLWEVLAADETLEAVLEFADRNADTLVILASDHGTGGGVVYGIGDLFNRSSQAFEFIDQRKSSFEYIMRTLGAKPEPSALKDAVREKLGVALTDDQARLVAAAVGGEPAPDLAIYHYQPNDAFGHALSYGNNYEAPNRLNHHYATGQHTAGPTPIAFYGAGVGKWQLGLIDNADLFPLMTNAIGVEYENPIMSEAEALRVIAERG